MRAAPVSKFLGWLFWRDAHAKVASSTVVCHEWLSTIGGSDKVAAEIANGLDADYVFALTVDDELVTRLGIRAEVIESRIGRFVRADRRWQLLLPLMPTIWHSLDLRSASTVVTSSHAFVNCLRGPAGRVVSYCHTPMRYAWDWKLERERIPRALRPLWPLFSIFLRRRDRRSSRSVHRYVANSRYVQGRIQRYYQRSSTVINPPIDLARWSHDRSPRDGYVLYAGRLVGYKRPDLAIEAARLADVPIVVAGDGPMLADVQSLDDEHVTVVPAPTDARLRELYNTCALLVFPSVEDFGMIPIEAQACGAPVIGVAEGGTLETVRHGETGLLVAAQTADALAEAITTLRDAPFEVLRHATSRFSRERFVDEIKHVVGELDTPVARVDECPTAEPNPKIGEGRP